MASYTPNLNLLKKSPVTDGNDTFNVDTMLNENWDKIDEALGDPTEAAQKLGLTGDLSAAASLGVLATAGDLYVWRRTTSSGTDYPVSVNPNAYQVGDPWYTLGDVINENKEIALSYQNAISYSSAISVSDDGSISLSGATQYYWYQENGTSGTEVLVGKFISGHTGSDPIIFLPSDTTFSKESTSDGYFSLNASKYQTVTGYPAIPAGTTIEYLGKLGDKARMQIVSYVGTGNSGASNPCSITADFPIKSATLLGYRVSSNNLWGNSFRGVTSIVSEELTNSFSRDIGFTTDSSASNTLAKISEDEKTISWYHLSSSEYQLNSSGYKYYFLFRG